MADVTNRLRAARERAGLEIEAISATTKIKASQLQALERGDFDRLPGEFFTRAFLRTYARELGLPPDEIVREYDASRGVPERTPEPARIADTSRRTPLPVVLRPEPDEPDSSGRLLSLPSPRSAWPVLALALVLLVGISMMNREPAASGQAGAVGTGGTVQPGAPPAATSRPPEPAPEKLSMEIFPSAEIWINAIADGERAVYRLVQPGERLRVEARNELSFRIGNAGAFQYALNGVPGRAVGGPGEVREFRITRDNFRTYHR